MRRLKREDRAGANGAAFGKHIAGGECSEDTAKTPTRQPLALIVELGGAIRRATDAELRRAARLGMIGGRA